MEALIRKATENDLEQLLALEQEIILSERPFDPTVKTEDVQYYDLRKMITADNVYMVVAELNGTIIGTGYARIETSQPYLKHTHHAYLGFMFVLPEYRGQGINKEIMSELKRWALEQGLTEMRLEVYLDNVNAIRAYEKFGFSRHMVEMRIGLTNTNTQ